MFNFKLNEDSFKSIVRLGMNNERISAEDAVLNQMVVTIPNNSVLSGINAGTIQIVYKDTENFCIRFKGTCVNGVFRDDGYVGLEIYPSRETKKFWSYIANIAFHIWNGIQYAMMGDTEMEIEVKELRVHA